MTDSTSIAATAEQQDHPKPKWNDRRGWWIYLKIISCFWIAIAVFQIGYFIEDVFVGVPIHRERYIALAIHVAQVLTGAGIIARQKWARFGGLAFSVLTCLKFPIGTAFGVLAIVSIVKTKESFGRPVNNRVEQTVEPPPVP